MRTILIFLFLIFDLAGYSQNTVYNYGAIPSGGASIILSPTSDNPTVVYVGTSSAVNLGANSYTLAYSSLPATGNGFFLYFDATNLTATAANVTLFGYQPLVSAPGIGKYKLRYDWNGSTVTVTCYADAANSTNVINRTTFNAAAYFNDSLVANAGAYLNGGVRVELGIHGVGSILTTPDTSGNLSWGCVPWCTNGNAGLTRVNYIGTSDTVDLRFGWDGFASGIIDGNKANTALGVSALYQNTSGTGNAAFGYASLASNTTGSNNTGVNGLEGNTTGSHNTGVGVNSLGNTTTGSNNTAIGEQAGQANITGSNNVTIGYEADVASSSTHNAIVVGPAIIGGSNQFTVGGESEYHPNMNNCVGCVMIDSTSGGTGVFIPKKLFGNTGTYFTPSTGDSISISTGKNTVNPSGTIANLTLIFPASPIAYQTYFFSFTQVVTAMHYSVRLSGGANPTGLPSAETVNGTFSAYYDPNLATWIPASH